MLSKVIDMPVASGLMGMEEAMELFDDMKTLLWKSSKRYGVNECDFDEVYQIARIDVLTSGGIDSSKNPRGYVWRTFKNRCIKYNEARTKANQLESKYFTDFETNFFGSRQATPPEILAENEEQEAKDGLIKYLYEMSGNIDGIDRRVLRHFYYDHMPCKKIANKVKRKTPAVRMRLKRGRAKLKKEVSRDMAGKLAALTYPSS